MRQVKDYIKITKLNKTKDMEALEKGLGYYTENAAACHNGEGMCFITYLEFPKGKIKGNHYHNSKEENMVVIKGKVKAKYYLPDDLEKKIEIILEEGDLVTILPGCAHAYKSDEGCSVIEFSKQKYNNNDVFKIDKMEGVF